MGRPGTDPGEFNTPHNVAADKDGWVYVADRENHRVQVFSPNGVFETQWVNMAKTYGLFVELAGEELVYVGGSYSGIKENPLGIGNWTGERLGPRVSILDKSGKLLARVGDQPLGEAAGQFIWPHGIAVDSQGDIYVAECSWVVYGQLQDLPREVRTIQKLVRRR